MISYRKTTVAKHATPASPSPSPHLTLFFSCLPFSLLLLFLFEVVLFILQMNQTKSRTFSFSIFSVYFVSFVFLFFGCFSVVPCHSCVPHRPRWRAGVGFCVKSPYYRADEAKRPIARAASLRICVQSERANQHPAVWLQ